jgi:hypothetical protein
MRWNRIGMAPRGVGAHQHDHVGQFQVVVADRHQVFAESALVARHGGRHAQARVGVDVGAADIALHQLVGDVVVLGQQLAGDVQRHRIRAVFGDDGLPRIGHFAERFIPRGAAQAIVAHLRIQQAAFQSHGFAQRRALDAQAALVGRMLLVASDGDGAIGQRRGLHAAANAAVGTGGTDSQMVGGQVQDIPSGGPVGQGFAK